MLEPIYRIKRGWGVHMNQALCLWLYFSLLTYVVIEKIFTNVFFKFNISSAQCHCAFFHQATFVSYARSTETKVPWQEKGPMAWLIQTLIMSRRYVLYAHTKLLILKSRRQMSVLYVRAKIVVCNHLSIEMKCSNLERKSSSRVSSIDTCS
jgi:hypothetical protein